MVADCVGKIDGATVVGEGYDEAVWLQTVCRSSELFARFKTLGRILRLAHVEYLEHLVAVVVG
jgi:hypothetical protein